MFCLTAPVCELLYIIKRNADAFSLSAIADVRLHRHHEMIVFEYPGDY